RIDGASSLKSLVARGMVEIVEDVRLTGSRHEVAYAVTRPLGDGELARAPRRRDVYQQIAAAGSILAADLRARDPGAAAHLRALLSAGLVTATPIDRAATGG